MKYSLSNIELIASKLNIIPDVIIVGWVSRFVGVHHVAELQKKYNAKVFWYLLDFAHMTGGCHYPMDCEGFKKDCSLCPAIKESDLSKKNYLQKRACMRGLDMEIFSISSWALNQASESSLFSDTQAHFLTAPVDENLYLLGNKKNIRNKYNISTSKKVILFAAEIGRASCRERV